MSVDERLEASPEETPNLSLPDGTPLPGHKPVIIIGPNGSGKTRLARQLTSPIGWPIHFVNALRNTRVTTEVPAVGLTNARNNLNSQADQARSQYWELVSDFDMLLARLHAEDAAAAFDFRDATRAGSTPDIPMSSMERLQEIWAKLLPGRRLSWNENVPMVTSALSGTEMSYQGHRMSDGEKAALYLAGKILIEEAGILVVDEPETHFHSLLAVDLWDELEVARPDLRVVYVTHDLTFALSRRGATFVLASPTNGLRVLASIDELATETAQAILGAASFSFYARRIIFCEGVVDGTDHTFYRAWFDGTDTVVRPVGSCDSVMRAAAVFKNTDLVQGVEVVGLIDRDYWPDSMITSLPGSVLALQLHEIESLVCLPATVSAVARHLGRTVDMKAFEERVRTSIASVQVHKVVIERWKRRVESPLLGLIGDVASRDLDLEQLLGTVATVFDHARWSFSPAQLLADEKAYVEKHVPHGRIEDILQIMPGKPIVSLAASAVGLRKDDYQTLVTNALAGDPALASLGASLEAALATYLPPRSIQT